MMDTNSVWEQLSSIQIGTVVAWILVICAIIGFLCTGTIKLYKIFTKYKKVQDDNKDLTDLVKAHEEKLNEVDMMIESMNQNINKQLVVIKELLNEDRETKIKQLRHSIVRAGEEAIANKHITIRAWSSLHEMYDEYTTKYKQNSYVKSLIHKVDDNCEVIGVLNEHGEDVD